MLSGVSMIVCMYTVRNEWGLFLLKNGLECISMLKANNFFYQRKKNSIEKFFMLKRIFKQKNYARKNFTPQKC